MRGHAVLVGVARVLTVDAEGFGLAVLESFEGLSRRQRPYLQVEMFRLRKSGRGYRLNLYNFLVRHGYEVHRMEGDANYVGDLVTAQNLMRWNVYAVFCLPRGTPR